MIFTKRIKAISNLVGKCKKVLDIGSDHAYLPIFLLIKNKCEFVCSSDISKSSVETAEQNFEKFKIDKKKYITVHSDGFNNIKNVDYDYVIITGLGSDSILNILKNRFTNIKYAILGPQKKTWKIRKWCNENNFSIVNEKLIKYNSKFYEYLKIDFSKKLKKKYSKTELYIGPILCSKKKSKLLIEFCQKKIFFYDSIPMYKNKEKIKYIKLFLKEYGAKI